MRNIFYLFFICPLLWTCTTSKEKFTQQVMTVTGPIKANLIGKTLEHEHVIVDFTGAEKVKQPQYPLKLALDTLLPHFIQLKASGVETLIDCTPNFIGRDVLLLKAISEQSGLNILTNTGYYAAAEKKYIPAHAYTESADQLAEKWIEEWNSGIGETGVKPGFIKLGVGKNSLDPLEQKIVKAGARTHLKTGLKIAIHTGSAVAANDEIDILEKEGVSPEALIVVHSQNLSSEEQIEIISRGAWVSLDGVKDTPDSQDKYVNFLTELKSKNMLNKTLISQDAYWLLISKQNGEFGFERFGSSYSAILELLLQKLKDKGFSNDDIDQLLVENPAKAYQIGVCRLY